MRSIDAALVARFGGDVERVFGRALEPDERIALAVSGGPDSMAMLALAVVAYPGQVVAATVDHRLRLASTTETRTVARWCKAVGVPHRTLIVREWIGPSAVQAQARALRYDLLARWVRDTGAACLATAHHVDDQAETFLMRAVRGSGPAGLAGIRPRRDQAVSDTVGASGAVFDVWTIPVIRPLLGWRRAELRAIATEAGVPFVDDPSNADAKYERARVRRLVEDNPWLDPTGLARAADHAAEADRALAETSQWLWATRKVVPDTESPDDESWLTLGDLPRELQRRLAREAIESVRAVCGILRPEFDRASNIEALLDALVAGKSATQAGILASAKGDVWRFREAPPRRGI